MEKQELYSYLDGNNGHYPDRNELLALLQEIESIKDPMPDPGYWNQFNIRLQQRLEQRGQPQKWWIFRVTPLRFAVTVFVAFLLVFVLKPTLRRPTLETLSTESLVAVDNIYEVDDKINLNFEDEFFLLFDEFDLFDGRELYEFNDFNEISSESLLDIWGTEG